MGSKTGKPSSGQTGINWLKLGIENILKNNLMGIIAKLPDLAKSFERLKAQILAENSDHPRTREGEESGGNGAVLPPKRENLIPDPKQAENHKK